MNSTKASILAALLILTTATNVTSANNVELANNLQSANELQFASNVHFLDEEEAVAPIDVVGKRMQALNDHDIDAFLACYAADVRILVYPNRLLNEGREHLREIFGPSMEQGAVRVEVDRMTAADGYVVVESTTILGEVLEPSVAIYEVRDGVIKSVCFLRDSVVARRSRMSGKGR